MSTPLEGAREALRAAHASAASTADALVVAVAQEAADAEHMRTAILDVLRIYDGAEEYRDGELSTAHGLSDSEVMAQAAAQMRDRLLLLRSVPISSGD